MVFDEVIFVHLTFSPQHNFAKNLNKIILAANQNNMKSHVLSDHSFKYCFTNLMKFNRTSSSKVTLKVPEQDAEMLVSVIPVTPNRVTFVTVSTSFSPETEPEEF